MALPAPRLDRTFSLMFAVMLTIAAGNTALQSVLPALGRSLGVADSAVAAAFSVSALMWVIAAPFWANRSDRYGHRSMILLGLAGFCASLLVCGLFLMMGINGWISGTAAFVAFVVGRMLYGSFGSAAPPAVQAIVAGRTSRDDRTRALALLASAFGLGTILGPAVAPYLVLGHIGTVQVGLAGPAFFALAIGAAMLVAVLQMLPVSGGNAGHGAASAYPSIGGQPSGASVTAATAEGSERVGFLDSRIRVWVVIGLIMGHAQAMTGQAIGFLVIDRLQLAPADALQPTGLVLMMGAGAALLVQWGFIPLLDLKPRTLAIVGLVIAAVGCAATGMATTLYGIAGGYALSAMGFGFVRPGYTAGASLAVGQAAQGSVAGKVTSVNGASFVLGPSIGVGLYELSRPLPYLTAAVALVALFIYAIVSLRPSARAP
ncbi:MFS transporter [Sphingomonas donggukensis]|uniref:MFS transporter n=1 Tax=Sphingomonas donggukensis TaxID=2949093 RepID=A0ABY4TY73_9SPHN|nr:MFS transporter [Sphingomonas donggukensis]URW75253.1 MFS transporter [Sphingomonas donggukensis]